MGTGVFKDSPSQTPGQWCEMFRYFYLAELMYPEYHLLETNSFHREPTAIARAVGDTFNIFKGLVCISKLARDTKEQQRLQALYDARDIAIAQLQAVDPNIATAQALVVQRT